MCSICSNPAFIYCIIFLCLLPEWVKSQMGRATSVAAMQGLDRAREDGATWGRGKREREKRTENKRNNSNKFEGFFVVVVVVAASKPWVENVIFHYTCSFSSQPLVLYVVFLLIVCYSLKFIFCFFMLNKKLQSEESDCFSFKQKAAAVCVRRCVCLTVFPYERPEWQMCGWTKEQERKTINSYCIYY